LHLEKLGWLGNPIRAYQLTQYLCQGRRIRHTSQFQRGVSCTLAPLELMVIPEELQQGQQPPTHPPVNLQIRTQPTVQRFRQTGEAVEQTQNVPRYIHDSVQILWGVLRRTAINLFLWRRILATGVV